MEIAGLVTAADGSGALLWVQAVPGARRSGVVGVHGDALRVKVAAPPEDGRANRVLEAFLAVALDVPTRSVEVVAGASSRRKRVRVGLDPAVLCGRLAALVT